MPATPLAAAGRAPLVRRLIGGTPAAGLDPYERRLLNDFQRDFPLVPRPFRAMGECLGLGEANVLERLTSLRERGFVRRVGPVFRARRMGASTLAAMQIPASRFDAVAAAISARPEVNHNYEREHRFNLWFVVTAADADTVRRTLAGIEADCGLPVLDLPLETAYHIDLGFDLFAEPGQRRAPAAPERIPTAPVPGVADEPAARLLRAVQGGLALEARPFDQVARGTGMEETEVLDRLRALDAAGHIKRFGVVVDHAALGYTANAMVVWDVPDAGVDRVAGRIASHAAVTLCYRRPRRPPHWRFNLFCMIHGRDRASVLATLDRIVCEEALQDVPHEVLFSLRCFKQREARYVSATLDAG